MYKIESLFKHNIFFAPSGEQTGDYSSNNKFSITYISKIYLKLNIEEHHGAENLLNQIDSLNFFIWIAFSVNLSKYVFFACQL